MAKTMLASGMTDGQIDDLANKLRDAARKHRDRLKKGPAQEVLRRENIGMVLFAEFCRLVEEISKQIVRTVTVNRNRTLREALQATGRVLYVNDEVVATMPRCEENEVNLIYFKPDASAYQNGWLSCVALAAEYEKRDLVPDPQAQIDDNAANSGFADTHPNACQWIDPEGRYCSAHFNRWRDERHVHVLRRGLDWSDRWFFAGRRK